MKLSTFQLCRLDYRNLRELVHIAHSHAEKDYQFTRSGYADWFYIVAFLKPTFEKDDMEVFRSDHYKFPLVLKIYEVESLIYMIQQTKPNPLHNLRGELINEVLHYKPNEKIYQNIVEYYNNSFLKKFFQREFKLLVSDEKEYVKERYFEQLNGS